MGRAVTKIAIAMTLGKGKKSWDSIPKKKISLLKVLSRNSVVLK